MIVKCHKNNTIERFQIAFDRNVLPIDTCTKENWDRFVLCGPNGNLDSDNIVIIIMRLWTEIETV